MATQRRRDILFGYFLAPEAGNPQEVLRLARLAEDAGLDLIGIQDHPYQRRYLDTWALLAMIAGQTSRISLCPAVANLPLRPPAMMAKAAASIDLLSGGRFSLGLGAGYFWEGIEALGGPVRTPGEAVDALEEAITVIRLLWSNERSARFDGRHYRLRGARPGPAPGRHIPIWIGGYGPRMLDLIGRLADGWLPSAPYAPPERLAQMQAAIDAGAAAAGRAPSAIRRMYNLFGQIRPNGQRGDFLQGPAEQWVDELSRLAIEHGLDSFLFGPNDAPADQVRRFAEEVVPRVRQNLAEYTSRRPGP
jgi:alkanesulfonate monooxygenase SsuD/methylene tetrahydromethanopterin reductase-like flavin-dependent oxidoreductase (luciferase family)